MHHRRMHQIRYNHCRSKQLDCRRQGRPYRLENRCGQEGSGKVTQGEGSTGGAARHTRSCCNPKPSVVAYRVRRRLRQ